MNIRAGRPDAVRRWPLYLAAAALLVVLAIAIVLMKSRAPHAPVVTPVGSHSTRATGNQVDRVRQDDKALRTAFEAATGHAERYRVVTEDGQSTIRPVEIVELPFGKALLTEQAVADGCHVCAGALGIYYFREEAGKIVVTGRWPRAIKGWGWGKPPSWQLTRKFTSLPAIWEAGRDGNMGIYSSGASITELRPAGPARSDPIDTGFEDEGAPDPNGRGSCMARGEIVNVRPDVGFDVRVTGGVSAVDRYRKRNGRFVAVSKIDWSDPCPRRAPPPPDSGPPSVG